MSQSAVEFECEQCDATIEDPLGSDECSGCGLDMVDAVMGVGWDQ